MMSSLLLTYVGRELGTYFISFLDKNFETERFLCSLLKGSEGCEVMENVIKWNFWYFFPFFKGRKSVYLNGIGWCLRSHVLLKNIYTWVEFVSKFCAALEKCGCTYEGMFDVKCILD